MEDREYSYNRFGSTGSRVGQAVMDIISNEQQDYTAEEILEEMQKGIMDYIQLAAKEGYDEWKTSFHIIHIFKKVLGQFEIYNAMDQKAICFKTGPLNSDFYMNELPNFTKTLFEVDATNGEIKLVWTVPGWEDCKSILKTPELYDEKLVGWTRDCMKKCKDYASTSSIPK